MDTPKKIDDCSASAIRITPFLISSNLLPIAVHTCRLTKVSVLLIGHGERVIYELTAVFALLTI